MSMNKIKEYVMIKDEFSHAKLEEVGCYEWNGELKYTDEIYKMLNKIFRMDRLITEVSYVVALDHGKKPKGVCRIGQGDANETPTSMQNIFTFLLLSGANAFVLVHNHISNLPEASMEDRMTTMRTNNLANMFDMEFIGNMIINPCGYLIDGGIMDGTNRTLDENDNLVDCSVCDEDDEYNFKDESYEDESSDEEVLPYEAEELMAAVRKLREEVEKGGI